jgi:hypothetical protein
MRATVTASALNVRQGPGTSYDVLGKIVRDTQLDILALTGDWGRIHYRGGNAYVHTNYLTPVTASDASAAQTSTPTNTSRPVREQHPYTRKITAAWQRHAPILDSLCNLYGIEPAVAIAVLCVESGGRAFTKNNGNRMVIRFENHKFWQFWGQHHPIQYARHFRFNARKKWTGHQWRRQALGSDWQNFHGKQHKEWEVLTFAETLDQSAARLSISMGAPQIMGFHYARIGYASVNEMFSAFTQSHEAQIKGLFAFFTPQMIRDLQTHQFTRFARAYNGSGQQHQYGQWIAAHYDVARHIVAPNQNAADNQPSRYA